MANVWRVGFPDHQANEQYMVGLLNVEQESAIVITPDGDVELFTSDGISKDHYLAAQTFKDKVMFAVNGS